MIFIPYELSSAFQRAFPDNFPFLRILLQSLVSHAPFQASRPERVICQTLNFPLDVGQSWSLERVPRNRPQGGHIHPTAKLKSTPFSTDVPSENFLIYVGDA